MLIAVDIGNTNTHIGIFNNGKLLFRTSFHSNAVPRKKNIYNILKSNLKKNEISEIKNIGIASVVSEMNLSWKIFFKKYFRKIPEFITSKTKLQVKLKINNPGSIGADRICNAVAGYEVFKRNDNVLVIDLGTASTCDVVLKNGHFIGGVIAPGVETSARSLHNVTSQLPMLSSKDFKFPKSPIGKYTEQAVQSGVMFSALDSMEGMIRRIENHLKVKFKIILTGGHSEVLYKKTKYKVVLKKDLVLYGINYIMNYNNVS